MKVLDFGIARALEEVDRAVKLTRAGTTPGTPAYMAPEVWSAEPPSPAADVYALGLVLLELAAGRHPLQPLGQPPLTSLQLMSLHMQGEVPPLRSLRPDAPERLERITSNATARAASQRYGSAKELAAELSGARDELSRPVPPRVSTGLALPLFNPAQPELQAPPPPPRSPRAPLYAGLVVGALTLGAAGLFLHGSASSGDKGPGDAGQPDAAVFKGDLGPVDLSLFKALPYLDAFPKLKNEDLSNVKAISEK